MSNLHEAWLVYAEHLENCQRLEAEPAWTSAEYARFVNQLVTFVEDSDEEMTIRSAFWMLAEDDDLRMALMNSPTQNTFDRCCEAQT